MIVTISKITTENVQAICADSFVESIGVNTHWLNTEVYTQNYTELKIKLAESGIRYIRDEAINVTCIRAKDLYNSLGIRTNILTGRRRIGPWPQPLAPTRIDEELNEVKTEILSATVSLEAPNEYDLSHGSDPDWVDNIRNYSSILYNKVKADAILKHLPVIGPSLTSFEAYAAVGDADQYIDYANLHMYQLNSWPGTNGSRNITWYLDYLAHQQSPSGKYIQATEAGYHNDLRNKGVSEEAEGKYTARMFAEFFRRGIVRTYKYELVNQGQGDKEHVFGLLRHDVSEKPSFRAVKNLIAILSDKGPDFKPDTFNYTLDGSIDNVHQILLQKRNGDFYLMVWLEVPSWDVNASIDLYPPPEEVVLTLQDTHEISNVTLYTLNNTADLNTINLTVNNSQITFNVTDKISILKLSNGTTSIPHGLYRLIPRNIRYSCFDFNQKWIIEPVGDGFYRIISQDTERLLDVNDCLINIGGLVVTDDSLDFDCQQWKFEPLLDGHYHIIPKYNDQDQCLDVQPCSLTGSTRVQKWFWLNRDCQSWKIDWIATAI